MKRISALLVVVVLGCVCVATAYGNPPTPQDPAGQELGIVPVHGDAGKTGGSGGSNLAYHNGPVMRTNRVYAIYWIPSGYAVSSGYTSLIDGFFKNVAADSGKRTNVYFSDTQYSDSTGLIAYSSAFGGSTVDTTPFPASGCSDSYTAICLTDAQLRSEIDSV